MMDFLWKNFFKTEEKSVEMILKENPLFEDLNNKELRILSQIVHRRSFIPGEFIFQEGKGLGMYIILSGKVGILHGASQGGESTVISQLKEGDFFGELCLAREEGYHHVSAQATEESKLLGFFRPDLLNLIEKTPSTGICILMKLTEILGERLQKAGEKLSQFKQTRNH
ncbi:MAG: cyclic nucleotide-binding domain-containing protein [Bdellovibrionales bacterium]|nr:cyclic nucleotide-binding domain-containing protein [Bdellovibrionales bacterium]